jgi:tetratricopeptide (TPR) repeat protein
LSSRKNPTHDPEGLSLEALESRGERLAEWISANPKPILGTVGAVLAAALVFGLVSQSRESAETDAAAALASVQRDYRLAMGADASAIDIAEPANPEAARDAREAAVSGLRGVIAEYAGSPTAVLATLDLGERLVELGRSEEAIAAWQNAADGAADDLRGLILERIGAQAELEGRLADAADTYERASEISGYPLRHQALAEAARLRASAGEAEAAIALLQRLEAESPDYALPDHVGAQLRELRAARSE